MKIASIGHYPIAVPLHGGQRRVAAIARQAHAAGHAVLHIPLHAPDSYPQATPDEAATMLPAGFMQALRRSGLREDLHLARQAQSDPAVIEPMMVRLRSFAPDIVQFEQPWLYPLMAGRLRSDPALARARLVYSSQNVEAQMVEPIWQAEAEALEQELVRAADLVVAVSAADAEVFARARAPSQRPPVVAPNGCWAPELDAPPPAREIAAPYALVAGSAHPPNAQGYWDCIGEIPGFLPPGSCLAIVGGMNDLIAADPRAHRQPLLAAEFLRPLGVVDEARLFALLWHATTICLPITAGGGTNLKTAEALMWLHPVVAMRAAMRGYEDSEALSGVYVADRPEAFRALLRDVMSGARGSDRRAADVARYGWPHQLAPLTAAYSSLLA